MHSRCQRGLFMSPALWNGLQLWLWFGNMERNLSMNLGRGSLGVPLLGGVFCVCTWHFFYNSESLEFLMHGASCLMNNTLDLDAGFLHVKEIAGIRSSREILYLTQLRNLYMWQSSWEPKRTQHIYLVGFSSWSKFHSKNACCVSTISPSW